MKVIYKKLLIYMVVVAMTFFVFVGDSCFGTNLRNWPAHIRQIEYISSADSIVQTALFYKPPIEKKVPLLVALHTWSGDYTQETSIPYAEWCINNKWVFIHPDFRGANKRPEATGSDKTVKDILSAVDYAVAKANVDSQRIYLVGCSGGGFSALLMAGRTTDIWAGVSAWVPISDLKAWYFECKKADIGYADDILKSCGGAPGTSFAVDFEYKSRSPITYLSGNLNLPLDINTGIKDGHTGSVAVSHSLRAFNLVASKDDRICEKDIQYFVEKAEVPPHLKKQVTDATYGDKIVLFRKSSGNSRITIFDGGHEIIYEAALNWLAKQKKLMDVRAKK
ncbi:MAG: alpha/beta hydrolase family protein [Planctomycetota bacterium]|jgi:hypothetical protein